MTNCLFLSVFNKACPCFLPPANEVCGEVMFLHASAILFTWGWGVRATHAPRHACPPAMHPPRHTCPLPHMPPPCHAPPPMIRSMSARYASYWNAFLFKIKCQGILNKVEIGNPESIIILYCNVSKGRDEQFHAYI